MKSKATQAKPISAAELEVMEVLWQQSPLSAQEVIAALKREDWTDKTVKTLLNRLLNKGVLAYRQVGRKYLYSPQLKREEFVREQTRSFVGRLFQGRVAPLVAGFAEDGRLSDTDIAELKSLLAQLEDDDDR